MAYDPGLAARVADALLTLGHRAIRQKNVFGGRGFLVGTSTFAVVMEDGLVLKMTADDYREALASPGVVPFAPGGEKPMSTWVVVAEDAVADDPELQEWVGRALRSVAR